MCFLSYLHKLHLKYNSMTRKSRSCGLPCNNATPYTRLLRMLVLRNTFIFSKHRFVLFTLISLFRMAFLGEMWMIFCRIFVPVWWKSYRNTICGLRIAIYTDIPVYCCSTNYISLLLILKFKLYLSIVNESRKWWDEKKAREVKTMG